MSTLEYKRCDYLGCIASVSLDDENDDYMKWGSINIQDNRIEERQDGRHDLCPEHLEAITNLLEGDGE